MKFSIIKQNLETDYSLLQSLNSINKREDENYFPIKIKLSKKSCSGKELKIYQKYLNESFHPV